MKIKNIDWPNHLIAFISSLLGILIAFQLQDWQENRNENQKVRTTLASLKQEIEGDLRIYNYNADTVFGWVQYCEFYLKHGKEHTLILSQRVFDSLRAKNPDRFDNDFEKKKYNDSLNLYTNIAIRIDVQPRVGISTNNWEAAKSSGVLNFLDQSRAAALTKIYYWINIDVGENDNGIYKMAMGDNRVDDLNEVMRFYKMSANVARFKRQKIEKIFNEMNWEDTKGN